MPDNSASYDTFTPKAVSRPVFASQSTTDSRALLLGKPQSSDLLREDEIKTTFLQRNVGLMMIMISGVFACSMNLVVKMLNDINPPVPTFELIVVRMAITYVFCMAYMFWTGTSDPWFGPKGVRFLLWFRGVSGFFSLFGTYFSLRYLSLSDSTVITFLTPLITSITGALFLGETYGRKQLFASVGSFAGVILIARPTSLFKNPSSLKGSISAFVTESATPEERLLAVGAALIGVLGSAGAYTTIRSIGGRAHPMHSMISFSSQSVVVGSLMMYMNGDVWIVPTDLKWAALLFMIGLLGFFNQLLLTTGFQRETAGRGTLAIYLQIVYSTFLEFIFYHTWPSSLSLCGAFIIISSALYVAVNEPAAPHRNVDAKAGENKAEEGVRCNNST